MDVEQLDQSYYDETELKEFVDSAVEEYNTENGKNSVSRLEPHPASIPAQIMIVSPIHPNLFMLQTPSSFYFIQC